MSAGHCGIGGTGTNGVDGNSIGTYFASESLDEADNGRLRRGIGGEFLGAVMRNARGDADDPTALLFSHGWNKGSRAEKIPAKIDIDGSVPNFFAQINDQRFEIYPCIVHENIRPPEASEGFVCQALNRGLAGNIDLRRVTLRAQGF